jgi:hypothetical protein
MADPHHVDANPDPTFLFDDPDPTCQFNADPNSRSCSSSRGDANLRPLVWRPSMAPFEDSICERPHDSIFEPSHLLNIDIDADQDPDVAFDVDPDPCPTFTLGRIRHSQK